MKLADLKKEVYRIARVTTTRQLKSQYSDIQPLDMRYKASWEKALATLKSVEQQSTDSQSTKTPPPDFEAWLSNPPEDLKDLFTEAKSALGSFDEKLEKAKLLTKTAKAMVSSLDEFAEASLAEAQQLAIAAKKANDISSQASLN